MANWSSMNPDIPLRHSGQLGQTATMSDTATRTTIPAWTVKDRLVKAREWAGLTQDEMARQLKRGKRSITRYEGQERPAYAVILLYSKVTGVPAWWIEYGDNPPPGAATDRYLTVVPITPHDRPGFTLTPLAA